MLNDWCGQHASPKTSVDVDHYRFLHGVWKKCHSQVFILWQAESATPPKQKRFSFVSIQLQSFSCHPSPSRVNTLFNVNSQLMKVRWSKRLMKLSINSNFWWPQVLWEWLQTMVDYTVKCIGPSWRLRLSALRRLHLAVLISSVNYGADRCSVTVRATSLAKLPSTGLRHPSFNHCRI